jgi:hypothetical protein
MHLKATQGKEIVFQIMNRIGVLADVAKILADMGIELYAVNASVDVKIATIRLVTADNLRAVDALREHGYNPRESGVILLTLPHKPGMLHRLSEILATEMIDIHHIYSTSCDNESESRVVLHTAHDDHALVRLNEARIGTLATSTA